MVNLESGATSSYQSFKNDGQENIGNADKEKSAVSESVPEEGSDEQPEDTLTCRDIFLLVSVLLVSFGANACYSLLAPFFPKEAAKKGVSTTLVGFIFASFEFIFMIFTPLFGYLMGRISPKPIYIAGSIVGSSCTILYGFLDMAPAGPAFITLTFVLRIVEAIGSSACTTAILTLVGSQYPTRRSSLIGLLETATGVGCMAGPALGGALYQVGGFGLPFFVVGAGVALFSIPPMFLLPNEKPTLDKTDDPSVSRWRLLARPVVAVSLFAPAFSGLCVLYIDPILAKYLEQFHLSVAIVGLFFVIGPFVYAITAPAVGAIMDKLACERISIVTGTLLMALGYLLLGPSPIFNIKPTLWLVGITFCFIGVGVSAAYIPTYALMLAEAREIGYTDSTATHGIISALTGTSFSFGSFIAPIIAGSLTEAVGFSWSTSVVALLGFILAIISFITYAILKYQPRPLVDIEMTTTCANDKKEKLDESSPLRKTSN